MLEYVLSEPNSYCVWISKERAGLQILPAGRRRIEDLTQEYLNTIRAKRDDLVLAKQLYDFLLGSLPPEAGGERLIVVPDGILNLLPFDTLHDSQGALVIG